MRSLLYFVWAGALAAGCVSPYLDTAAPSDATFALACELPGSAASAGRLRIDVAFANVARHYSFGCEHRAELLARLQTIADLWCDGMPVAPAKVGTLVVATTTSELSDKRGATIDDGEGYVAFQCDGWLPELIAALGTTACCGSVPASAATGAPSPPTVPAAADGVRPEPAASPPQGTAAPSAAPTSAPASSASAPGAPAPSASAPATSGAPSAPPF